MSYFCSVVGSFPWIGLFEIFDRIASFLSCVILSMCFLFEILSSSFDVIFLLYFYFICVYYFYFSYFILLYLNSILIFYMFLRVLFSSRGLVTYLCNLVDMFQLCGCFCSSFCAPMIRDMKE